MTLPGVAFRYIVPSFVSSSRFLPPLSLSSASSHISTAGKLASMAAASTTPSSRSSLQDMSTTSKPPPPRSLYAFVPKEETNAGQFLNDHPDFDGRNVTIGVLDTGVDPGAIGMQCLPHCDDVKLVDIVDCSGSGDIDVSTEVNATWVQQTEEGGDEKGHWEVKGLSGKTLRLNPDWKIVSFPPKKDGSSEATKETSNAASSSDPKQEPENPTSSTTPGTDTSTSNATTTTTTTTSSGEQRKVPVRLGIKRAYELFPKRLITRVKTHRRKAFEEAQRMHAAKIRKELDRWHEARTMKTATKEQIRIKEDLEERLKFVENGNGKPSYLSTLWDDPGPIYDCVVYHDGTNYRAAIDTNEDGDLTKAKSMTDFNKEKHYETFGNVDMLNYGINLYDEGTVLSVVCDGSPHGSHVSGIAAAYNPEESNAGTGGTFNVKNGVAPGAKIISLKIGDTRLSTAETGLSLTRALIEAIRRKCDLINLSYGEAYAFANRGRFNRLADDLVKRYGITFVTSAGNDGPALSTAGAPGGSCSATLSVGAYVSPDMMEKEYSLITSRQAGEKEGDPIENDQGESAAIGSADEEQTGGDEAPAEAQKEEPLTGTTYTWSSVGPATDGDQGVDICAPGGAITCVPNWTLQCKQLMNGTSMSSPYVAGCIALLLSACKAMGISTCPSRIRRAVLNTARKMDGLNNLEQGYGMIQVDKAWEYILAHKDEMHEDVNFSVCISNRAGKPRGVYLRQADELSALQSFLVEVTPQIRKDDVAREAQRLRVEFDMSIELESTAPSWIRSPDSLLLAHNGRSFKIEVDPTSLPPGLHTGHVHGYDANSKSRGPIFSLPVTAVKPLERAAHVSLGRLRFSPSEVKRHFLDVPPGATWMDVSVKDCREAVSAESESSSSDGSPRIIVLHTLQLLPEVQTPEAEEQKNLSLLPGELAIHSIPVHGGVICELALARYWSALGETAIDVEVDFRGVAPTPDMVQLESGCGGAAVRVVSSLRDETISPTAKLTKWSTPIRPKNAGIATPLGERDVWPSENKRIYQMMLTYEFNQPEEGGFTPRFPVTDGYLYESPFDSQILMVFDKDKKMVGTSHAYPKEMKVPKGTVTVRVQVRHEKAEILNRFKDQILWIERKMSKEIPLSVYGSQASMVTGGATFKKTSLRKGKSLAVFVEEPSASKVPDKSKPGDILEGTINYASGLPSLPGQGKKPKGFKVRYVVGPAESKEGNGNGSKPEEPDERSEAEKLEEVAENAKIKRLEKLSDEDKDDKKFSPLFEDVKNGTPDSLPLLLVGLKHSDQERWRAKRLESIIAAADDIIARVNEDELVLYYGVTGYYDKEDGKATAKRKEMDKKKDALVEALGRKARAIADLENRGEKLSGEVEGEGEGDDETTSTPSFSDAMKELRKWIDVDTNLKFSVLKLEEESRAGRPGSVLKLLKKLLEKDGDDTKGGICHLSKSELWKRLTSVLEELEFEHLVEYDKAWRSIFSQKDATRF